jgi:hypothetical protein
MNLSTSEKAKRKAERVQKRRRALVEAMNQDVRLFYRIIRGRNPGKETVSQ